MLLRRVLMHFRKQDWIAIGLDFVIVVVGIFVGLQVSQWNDDRQDRVLEQQYLQSLKSDFESDIGALDDAIERARNRAQLLRSVQSAITAGHVDDEPNDFIWAVFNTNLLNYPVYTRTTINDLMSTGNLQLVQDRELKKTIADYYADIEYKEQWTTNWRDMQIAMEYTQPDLLEFRIREAGQLRYIGGPEWVTEPFEFDLPTAEDVLQKIIGHPLAKGQIENMTRIQDTQYENLTLVRQNAVELVNSLDASVKL